jgi:hypothetical protein
MHTSPLLSTHHRRWIRKCPAAAGQVVIVVSRKPKEAKNTDSKTRGQGNRMRLDAIKLFGDTSLQRWVKIEKCDNVRRYTDIIIFAKCLKKKLSDRVNSICTRKISCNRNWVNSTCSSTPQSAIRKLYNFLRFVFAILFILFRNPRHVKETNQPPTRLLQSFCCFATDDTNCFYKSHCPPLAAAGQDNFAFYRFREATEGWQNFKS